MKKIIMLFSVVVLILVACNKNNTVENLTTKENGKEVSSTTENVPNENLTTENTTTEQPTREGDTLEQVLEAFESTFLGEHSFMFDLDLDGSKEKVGFLAKKYEEDFDLYNLDFFVYKDDNKVYENKTFDYMYWWNSNLRYDFGMYIINYNGQKALLEHVIVYGQSGCEQYYKVITFNNEESSVVEEDEVLFLTVNNQISTVEEWLTFYNNLNKYLTDDAIILFDSYSSNDHLVYSEEWNIVYGDKRLPRNLFEGMFWWVSHDKNEYENLPLEERFKACYDDAMKLIEEWNSYGN